MSAALINLELPWTVQPQYAAGLNSAAVAEGLIAAAVPAGSALRVLSAVGTSSPIVLPSGSGLDIAPGLGGLGAGQPGAATTNYFPLHPSANATTTVWERPSAQVSVLVCFVRAGNNAGNSPLFGNMSPSTSPYAAWGLVDSSGLGTLRFDTAAGGSYAGLSGSAMTNGRLTTAIATYDGVTKRLYMTGAAMASAAASGALSYPNGSDRGPALGNFYNFGGGTRSFNGRIFLAALWDKALPERRVDQLLANPWQLFEPRRIIIPVSAGPGGGTIAAAGIASGEAFGSPAVAAGVTTSGIASGEAFGAPVVGVAGIVVAGIASAEAFGSAGVAAQVVAAGIASAEAVGVPVVSAGVVAAGITSSEAFGSLGLAAIISAAGIGSAEAFGLPAVGNPEIVCAGIPSGEAFGLCRVGEVSSEVPAGGGSAIRARLLRRFADDEERRKAKARLPALGKEARDALRQAAADVAQADEVTPETVEQRISEALSELGQPATEAALDWMLYFLRVQADAERIAQAAAQRAIARAMREDDEEAALLLLLA